MAAAAPKGITLEQLKEGLTAGKIPRRMLLECSDPYMTRWGLGHLRQALFGSADLTARLQQGDEEHFRCEELGKKAVEAIAQSLATVSMFTPKRLLVVYDLQELGTPEQETLLEYMAKAGDETTLFLQASKLHANSKFRRQFAELGKATDNALVNFQIDKPVRMAPYIRMLATEKGLQLEDGVVDFLIEYVATDLGRVEMELEKIALYLGGGGKVGVDLASNLTCSTNLQSVFQLTDAIGAKQTRSALQTLRGMLERGEAPLMLLTMIARHVRQLYRIKMVADQRVSMEQVAKGLETQSDWVINKLRDQARRFTLPALRGAIKRLYQLDRDLKTSAVDPEKGLEHLVLQLSRS